MPEVLLSQAVHCMRKARHDLDLAIDGFPRDHYGAQKHPQRTSVRHGGASIARREVLIKQLDEPEVGDEVIGEEAAADLGDLNLAAHRTQRTRIAVVSRAEITRKSMCGK